MYPLFLTLLLLIFKMHLFKALLPSLFLLSVHSAEPLDRRSKLDLWLTERLGDSKRGSIAPYAYFLTDSLSGILYGSTGIDSGNPLWCFEHFSDHLESFY